MTAPPPPRQRTVGPPRPRDAQATRGRLIRAALDLFTSQGFRATTTPEIAQRAGVAEATIYRHFAGKDALLIAACVEAQNFGRALVALEESEHDGDTRAALIRIGHRLVEGAERDPALLRMLLRPPEEVLLEEPTRRAMREFRSGLEQVMAAGKQRGQVRPGSAELWAAVWLALAGFVVERVAAKEWSREHPNVEQALEAGWEAIAYRRPDTPLKVVT
jgi:AcrR family transcriptional regulator